MASDCVVYIYMYMYVCIYLTLPLGEKDLHAAVVIPWVGGKDLIASNRSVIWEIRRILGMRP